MIAVLLAFVLSVSFAHAQNLVTNGTFDTSVAGWGPAASGCTVTWNSADANDSPSSGSAKVVSLESSSVTSPDFCFAQTIAVPENTAYAFTAKTLPSSGFANVDFMVRALASDNRELGFRRYVLSGTTWTSLSKIYVTPIGTAKVQIGAAVQNFALIDDVAFRPASPAPTPVVSVFVARKPRLCTGETTSLYWISEYASAVTIDHGLGSQPVSPKSDYTGASVAPTQTTTYTLTASGPGGSTTAQVTLPVDDGPPDAAFTATPATIGPGASSTLAWTTARATTVTLQQGADFADHVSLNGSFSVTPNETTIYTLTVAGACATVKKQVTVTVAEPTPQITFIASSRTIAEGETTTLSWTVTNATSVSIDHGIGARPVSGSVVVVPDATTTYRLTASGPGGTSTADLTITVLRPPVIVFTATPNTITVGQATTLAWMAADATLVVIDNGIGGQVPSGAIEVRPQQTTTYVLTATGPGGVRVAQTMVTVKLPSRRRPVAH
ncbi:MAG: hypothetical protein AABO58_00960 [Acidobacteriota bacterium]